MAERLIDIVQSSKDGIELNHKFNFYSLIARYNTALDNSEQCLWMYLNDSKYRTPEQLKSIGLYVYRDSILGKRILNGELGEKYNYKAGKDYHGKPIEHTVEVYNQCDFTNKFIKISGDTQLYEYDDLYDYLRLLREKEQQIIENEEKTRALEEEKKRLQEERDTAIKRGLIQKEINRLRETRLELTLQIDELQNLTRYIREQGKLRFNPILDPVQNRIKTENLYDGQILVIDGGPGTGKTTTMIQRLKYLTDLTAIQEDYDQGVMAYNLDRKKRDLLGELVSTKRDWVFFSPSELLKGYLADAMNREGFADTNTRVHHWDMYRTTIIRDMYGFIDPTSNNSPFNRCRENDKPLILHDNDAINDLNNYFLNTLKQLKNKFPKIDISNYPWYYTAKNIQSRFDEVDDYSLVSFIGLFSTLETNYSAECNRYTREYNELIKETTEELLGALSIEPGIKDQLSALINEDVTVDAETEDELTEDEDAEVEFDIDDILYKNVRKWLRRYAYKRIDNTIKLTKRQESISAIIEPHINDEAIVAKVNHIGELVLFERYSKLARGVKSNLLTGIPTKYKAFRKDVLKAGKSGWDLELLKTIVETRNGKQLHKQEQSLLIGFINMLVKNILNRLPNDKISHKFIDVYNEICRPIIGIDEATDFSVIDIYAMMSITRRDLTSITLCGDIMQRLTMDGIQSWNDLYTIVPEKSVKVVRLKTSYRQSSVLLDVAKKMYFDTLGEYPIYTSHFKSKKVPDPLMYVSLDEDSKINWIEKRIQEVYIAYGKRLPSIAIFMNHKDKIADFVDKLRDSDFIDEANIKVINGSEGNVRDDANQIRVYPIDVVKGMEFDVVFFHDIDNANLPDDLIKRLIYVGVSRAAFFLGITLNSKENNYCKYFKEGNWSKMV